MKDAQAELKAIAAELQSIRAGRSSYPSSTVLEPPQPLQANPNSTPLPPSSREHTQSPLPHSKSHPTPSTPTKPLQSFPLPGSTAETPLPEQLAAMVELLQQRSAPYLQPHLQPHLQPPHSQPPTAQPPASPPLPSPPPSTLQFDHILHYLEAQADRINQLAILQETAMRELKATAEQVRQTQQSPWRSNTSAEPLPICEYLEAVVPHVEKTENGALILKTRSIDLHQAEREANLTAQALRQRQTRGKQDHPPDQTPNPKTGQPVPQSWGVQLWRSLWGSGRSTRSSQSRHLSQSLPSQSLPSQSLQASVLPQPRNQAQSVPERKPRRKFRKAPPARRSSASRSTFTVREGFTLLLGAIFIRVLLDLVVAAYPMLWVPSMVMLVAPAAIAVYRTNSTPETGFTWGYRLFSIMIGLLLGGRL